MPKLLLKFGPAVVKEYPVPPTQTSVTLGRKPDNDIVIDNPVVSGHHARIIKVGDTFFVEDLNSTNGTFLAGRKIIKSGLAHGDEISIGSHTVLFIDDAIRPPEEKSHEDNRPPALDQTMVIDPAKRAELLGRKKPEPGTPSDISLPLPATAATPPHAPSVGSAAQDKIVEKVGTFVVTSGGAEKMEYELSGLVTYIGKSDNAHIRLKGLFLPEMGAAINKRQEGYVIVALKDGFPEINGRKLTGQATLQDGDEVKMGGVTFRFYLKEITR